MAFKMNWLELKHLRDLVSKFTDLDLFDFHAEIDSTLTYGENKNILIEKLKPLLNVNELFELGFYSNENPPFIEKTEQSPKPAQKLHKSSNRRNIDKQRFQDTYYLFDIDKDRVHKLINEISLW